MFKELLLVAIGKKPALSRAPEAYEWEQVYHEACKQSLQGVLFGAVKRLPEDQKPDAVIYKSWLKQYETIAILNDSHVSQCAQITQWLDKKAMPSCILKGEAYGLFYPVSSERICGDIDIWVPGNRDRTIRKFRSCTYDVHDVVWQECKIDFFSNVSIDLHFHPTRFYNPTLNSRIQKFYEEESSAGFNMCEHGFRVPSPRFSTVFCICHIYNHVVDGGVGLRQMLDLYYILNALDSSDLEWIRANYRRLGLGHITADIMYVLETLFMMDREKMICKPSTSGGIRLLSIIQRGGNFGHAIRHRRHRTRFGRFLHRTKRILQNTSRYPRETLWAPFYKVWHICWRIMNGYN